MFERQVLATIGQKLLDRGKCPHHAACPYGFGDQCTASEDVVREKLDAITVEIAREPGCIGMPNLIAPGPWPCGSVMAVKFVDDDEALQQTK